MLAYLSERGNYGLREESKGASGVDNYGPYLIITPPVQLRQYPVTKSQQFPPVPLGKSHRKCLKVFSSVLINYDPAFCFTDRDRQGGKSKSKKKNAAAAKAMEDGNTPSKRTEVARDTSKPSNANVRQFAEFNCLSLTESEFPAVQFHAIENNPTKTQESEANKGEAKSYDDPKNSLADDQELSPTGGDTGHTYNGNTTQPDALQSKDRFDTLIRDRDSLRAEVTDMRKSLEEIQSKHHADMETLQHKLDDAESKKEHAESQFQKLLERVNTIKSQLGERLKEDAVSSAQPHLSYLGFINLLTGGAWASKATNPGAGGTKFDLERRDSIEELENKRTIRG